MSRQSTMEAGRRFTEASMTTLGIIQRDTGATTSDPITYEETPVYETIYTGKCKVKFPDMQPAEVSVPGMVVVEQDAILSLPIEGSGGVRVDDIWTCTENVLDPSLVGVKLRIAGVHHQTSATARRFPVREGN